MSDSKPTSEASEHHSRPPWTIEDTAQLWGNMLTVTVPVNWFWLAFSAAKPRDSA